MQPADLPPLPTPPTASDLAWLEQRLGRHARGLAGIAARSTDGRPSVIATRPLLRFQSGRVMPFPTVYWLVCPRLSAGLARLEMVGWIERVQAWVDGDPSLHPGIESDHDGYIRCRLRLLSQDDAAWLDTRPAIRERLSTVGIGGMAGRLAVKCFHAQYAWHLVRPSVVGGLIDRVMAEASRAPGAQRGPENET